MNYLVTAMGRSGHRYICAWIAENLYGNVMLHRNCVNGWNQGMMNPDIVIDITNPGKGKHTIKTIEEMHTCRVEQLVKLKYYKESKFIVVVRSPRNWLASCLAGGGHFVRNMEKARQEISKSYWVLYPFSRLTAYKSYFNRKLPKKTIVINYDKFVLNKKYKSEIRKALNLENIVSDVMNDGNQKKNSMYGYSSFYDECYTERYNQLSDRKTEMLEKLMDDEMIEIEKKHFS